MSGRGEGGEQTEYNRNRESEKQKERRNVMNNDSLARLSCVNREEEKTKVELEEEDYNHL